MNKDITELVDLPDPVAQPLVHPLDVPEARRPFRTSWLITALTDPAVGLCVAVIVWFGSQNYVVPLIAGGALVGFGALASHFYRSRAWAFIPRKRQDRQRPLPVAWELGAALVFATALSLALLLLAFRLSRPDAPSTVREFTFGMSAAVGVLVVAEFVGKLRHHGAQRRRALFTLPGIIAVIGSVALAYGILFDWSGRRPSATMVWGATTMLAVGIAVGAWKYMEARRGIPTQQHVS